MAEKSRHSRALRLAGSQAHSGSLSAPAPAPTLPHATLPTAQDAANQDHFVERDGLRFAGTHLIVDLWGASNLDDLETIEQALQEATKAAGATLLRIDLHSFAPTGGITGVAVLAESHISIHTWPERAYAAVDIFMCGNAKPHKALQVIRAAFAPENLVLLEHRRGLVS